MVWKILAALVALLVVGGYLTREKVDLTARFDPNAIGDDVDIYLADVEGNVPNLREGVAKRVVWATEARQKTPLSIIYLHGFSATSEEIRPVPDQVAATLGANLYYARLAGHGRDGAAMAEPTVADWVHDLDEALAIGRTIGEELLILSTSTGGTLAMLAATDPARAENVKGMVLISPNYGINNPMAPILSAPFARYFVPLIEGHERSFETKNDAHAAFWTARYPVVSALPLQALLVAVRRLDFSTASVPALFIFSDNDTVVRADLTRQVAGSWGDDAQIVNVEPGTEDDQNAHVLAGDIMSPGLNATVRAAIEKWVADL
ncbi:hypothetical protein ACMU_03460 [Actibacterium mucosum KCTC 23349]|uniref:Serine aminopeptidase S33 domain-containing protein n=1 Tax=Actibacterium mucosum KCTC 23349 TaxID=1454373 RepID=A0A037ZEW2_9RHOB|nr:alpha/beta fold hydrolase [Actibacterium mucosum]KAJ54153.1 hypothetical protein ACMU_03460 [Actibacterium mucosum KCTC 23349]